MKVLIPMGDSGERFASKGYTDPKPMIRVNGKRIIEYVAQMYTPSDELVFIANSEHLDSTNMREEILKLSPTAKIVSIPPHTLGPVYTVRQAFDHIKDDDEVVVSYCDSPLPWDYEDFTNFVRDRGMDGCVLTHTGFHPHTLSHTKMAFIKGHHNILEEIQEKKCYTDNPFNEHASSGVYYFRRGRVLKEMFARMIDMEYKHTNGEYYVTLVYNLMVQAGLKVGYYDTPHVTQFGTPEEVQNFDAWMKILEGAQVHSVEDAIKCYNYWKSYKQRIAGEQS